MNLKISKPAGGPGPILKTSPAGLWPGRQTLAWRGGPVAARCPGARGMTLPEMMVAVAVGSLILMVMAQVFMGSAFSFAAMSNYVSMDARSRNALDHMTREIRQASDLLEFSSTRLKFALQRQTNACLVYEWNAQSRQLTEWNSQVGLTNVLLTDCDQLAFSMRDSLFAPTTTLAEGKGIRVAWKCSRTILGNRTTSEDMEQALIIMRNKPI